MSLKPLTILVAALAMSSLFAGCGGKDDKAPATSGTPTGSGTMTTTPGGGTTSPPVTTATSAPKADEVVFNETIAFKNDGTSATATFDVANGTTQLTYSATTAAPGPGPFVSQGPGTPPAGNPNLEFLMGTSSMSKTDLETGQGASAPAGGAECAGAIAPTPISAPMAGSWTISLNGRGQNCAVTVTVTAKFT